MNVHEPLIEISTRSLLECLNGTVIETNERRQEEDATVSEANVRSKWEATPLRLLLVNNEWGDNAHEEET